MNNKMLNSYSLQDTSRRDVGFGLLHDTVEAEVHVQSSLVLEKLLLFFIARPRSFPWASRLTRNLAHV